MTRAGSKNLKKYCKPHSTESFFWNRANSKNSNQKSKHLQNQKVQPQKATTNPPKTIPPPQKTTTATSTPQSGNGKNTRILFSEDSDSDSSDFGVIIKPSNSSRVIISDSESSETTTTTLSSLDFSSPRIPPAPQLRARVDSVDSGQEPSVLDRPQKMDERVLYWGPALDDSTPKNVFGKSTQLTEGQILERNIQHEYRCTSILLVTLEHQVRSYIDVWRNSRASISATIDYHAENLFDESRTDAFLELTQFYYRMADRHFALDTIVDQVQEAIAVPTMVDDTDYQGSMDCSNLFILSDKHYNTQALSVHKTLQNAKNWIATFKKNHDVHVQSFKEMDRLCDEGHFSVGKRNSSWVYYTPEYASLFANSTRELLSSSMTLALELWVLLVQLKEVFPKYSVLF